MRLTCWRRGRRRRRRRAQRRHRREQRSQGSATSARSTDIVGETARRRRRRELELLPSRNRRRASPLPSPSTWRVLGNQRRSSRPAERRARSSPAAGTRRRLEGSRRTRYGDVWRRDLRQRPRGPSTPSWRLLHATVRIYIFVCLPCWTQGRM